MNLQPIFDIPEICAQIGVKHAVISPGSRNGALTIAFARNPNIECFSIPDERSAAFIGLGMSLQTKAPTVLICTSGSAGLNYAPAVAEAFFNRVPLLIITADRPEELINIRDGQTIYQKALYGRHVKHSFEFPIIERDNQDLTPAHDIIEEAIKMTTSDKCGPVHINIPFREPFYPSPIAQYSPSFKLASTNLEAPSNDVIWPDELEEFEKVLIVAGQGHYDENLRAHIEDFVQESVVPVIADSIANLNGINGVISHHDAFLHTTDQDELKPDLILTFGLSILSKKLKQFLRKSNAQHWHIDCNRDSADTFGLLSKEIACSPSVFFRTWKEKAPIPSATQKEFNTKWRTSDKLAKENIQCLKFDEFSETSAYHYLNTQFKVDWDVHLANSMAVRYINLFGIDSHTNISCNRGTSGIDGSNSTAVGYCIVSKKPTLLITGDVAFLYDRNAFWHNHLPDSLSVIVFNNGGGGIFRLIKGPSKHKELEQFFETDQKSTAKHVAAEFGFQYLTCDTQKEFEKKTDYLLSNTSQRVLLEVFTDKMTNAIVYKAMLAQLS